ncbi:hypothetical protein MM213_17315 [Belliella sp. R4-6]|uniref:Uncharacterized protein n=1 Tax=Belliella alkalica TaxID=1730871 RepID=A0ABS9VFP0_9BACT|nr:hypothetical protein [Belliella alkalica]MCH7415263.1 hypothetical protein [Belliella alkalica]
MAVSTEINSTVGDWHPTKQDDSRKWESSRVRENLFFITIGGGLRNEYPKNQKTGY